MPLCSSCMAQIKWIKTFGGKNMPVDPEQIYFQEGGEEIFVTDGGAVIHGTRCGKEQINARTWYISHFATCPNADMHRKKK